MDEPEPQHAYRLICYWTAGPGYAGGGVINGEPLLPDRVFDFPMDEPEPQHAYDFFALGPLPGYAGNPNNMNGWIEADVPLLGELGEPLRAEVDEPMVDLVINDINGEPLLPDRVFDFPMDEPEPQHAYDFFALPLPGYAGNPNNINGWIEADVPLLGELGEMGEPLGAEVDEPMVDLVIEELAELIVEVE
ncbi:hypothetical protein Tco_1016919 [Tanacetum coccineum]|uniref:Uncharacterized protein n=1 Tax=Tanacetum coccineum TaxID=301880 RepID=A0ABQ5FQK4_9ASTR